MAQPTPRGKRLHEGHDDDGASRSIRARSSDASTPIATSMGACLLWPNTETPTPSALTHTSPIRLLYADLVREVCAYLNWSDLVRVTRVCSFWNRTLLTGRGLGMLCACNDTTLEALTQHPLRHHVNQIVPHGIWNSNLSLARRRHLFHAFPNLTVLSDRLQYQGDDESLPVYPPTLKDLSLTYSAGTAVNQRAPSDVDTIRRLQTLPISSLHLFGTQNWTREVEWAEIGKMVSLRWLYPPDGSLSRIGSALDSLVHLEELVVSPYITAQQMEVFARLPNLRKFRCSRMTREHMRVLQSFRSAVHSLELSCPVRGDSLNDTDFVGVNLSQLRSLDLEGFHLHTQPDRGIFSPESMPNIEEITLRCCRPWMLIDQPFSKLCKLYLFGCNVHWFQTSPSLMPKLKLAKFYCT